MTVPFYKDVTLFEGEVKGSSGDKGVLSFLLHGKGVTVLDGTANPIHAVNAWMPVDLNTQEKAQLYLRFFTAAISGDGGNFRIVQDPAHLAWNVQADAQTKQTVVGQVTPLIVYPTDGQSWQAAGTVQYGKDLYRASFFVGSKGQVKMEGDTLVLSQLPISQDKYIEGVRYKVF